MRRLKHQIGHTRQPRRTREDRCTEKPVSKMIQYLLHVSRAKLDLWGATAGIRWQQKLLIWVGMPFPLILKLSKSESKSHLFSHHGGPTSNIFSAVI